MTGGVTHVSAGGGNALKQPVREQSNSIRRPLSGVSCAAADDVVNRILGSTPFENAGRLRDFLTYVVREELAGRGEGIRGKTIAQDVYGRTAEHGADSENIVRVDARRLRQQLDHYYATEGMTDPVRLHLEPGSYRPRFEATHGRPEAIWRKIRVGASSHLSLFVIGTVVGLALNLLLPPRSAVEDLETAAMKVELTSGASTGLQAAERRAIREKSASSLEAISLAEHGRRMMYPLFDLPRQELLTPVFEYVIELDPAYHGGYSGLAYVLASRALLAADPAARAELLARSDAMAQTALSLDPKQAWTLSALARVSFVRKDYDEAMRLAELSAQIGQEDDLVLDGLAAIALFSGQFQRSIEAANDGKPRPDSNQRFANRNIFAAASYHIGDYRAAYEALEQAVASGAPISPPSLAYQAAALAAMGREKEARHKLEELERTWPGAPLDIMFYGRHSEKRNADAVLDRLRQLGWKGK